MQHPALASTYTEEGGQGRWLPRELTEVLDRIALAHVSARAVVSVVAALQKLHRADPGPLTD